MPGWNIHLEAGRRLSKRIKLPKEVEEEFLFGCLLPDINNGYVNKKVKEVKEHHETHWAFNDKSSLNFYASYKKQVDERDPIYLGYLLHLYTDGYFNYNFYRTVKRRGKFKKLTREEKQDLKHNDFWKYDAEFSDCEFVVRDKENVVKKANKIQGVKLDEEEVEEIEEIMNSDKFEQAARERDYIFYTKEKLDVLMEEMLDSFVSDYVREENA